jgi:RHS repeat-associated protein
LPGTYISPAETGFYLTGTRYYDSEIGRFVNADGYVSTGVGIIGNNMYAYCINSPVNYTDPYGMAPYRLFNSTDEAALNFAKYYNAKSIKDKQEYGSTIYRYTYTETRSTIEKVKFKFLN